MPCGSSGHGREGRRERPRHLGEVPRIKQREEKDVTKRHGAVVSKKEEERKKGSSSYVERRYRGAFEMALTVFHSKVFRS